MIINGFPGINIQWPISELILAGKKKIETRTYPIPSKYLGKSLLFIETPGKNGKFSARVMGVITFSHCFKYESEKEFYLDYNKHLVEKDSIWAWKKSKPKWGWTVSKVELLPKPIPAPTKRGIVFTSRCEFR